MKKHKIKMKAAALIISGILALGGTAPLTLY